MYSDGYFTNGDDEWVPGPDGKRWGITQRSTKAGDILSVRFVKDTKKMIFGINEHFIEFKRKDHRIPFSDRKLQFRIQCVGGAQITIVPFVE